MAKNNKFKDSLSGLGSAMSTKVSDTPMQKTMVIPESDGGKTLKKLLQKEEPTKVEETRFTVHIPTPLMDRIKDIGHFEKKKIKTMFVEALEAYANKHEVK